MSLQAILKKSVVGIMLFMFLLMMFPPHVYAQVACTVPGTGAPGYYQEVYWGDSTVTMCIAAPVAPKVRLPREKVAGYTSTESLYRLAFITTQTNPSITAISQFHTWTDPTIRDMHVMFTPVGTTQVRIQLWHQHTLVAAPSTLLLINKKTDVKLQVHGLGTTQKTISIIAHPKNSMVISTQGKTVGVPWLDEATRAAPITHPQIKTMYVAAGLYWQSTDRANALLAPKLGVKFERRPSFIVLKYTAPIPATATSAAVPNGISMSVEQEVFQLTGGTTEKFAAWMIATGEFASVLELAAIQRATGKLTVSAERIIQESATRAALACKAEIARVGTVLAKPICANDGVVVAETSTQLSKAKLLSSESQKLSTYLASGYAIKMPDKPVTVGLYKGMAFVVINRLKGDTATLLSRHTTGDYTEFFNGAEAIDQALTSHGVQTEAAIGMVAAALGIAEAGLALTQAGINIATTGVAVAGVGTGPVGLTMTIAGVGVAAVGVAMIAIAVFTIAVVVASVNKAVPPTAVKTTVNVDDTPPTCCSDGTAPDGGSTTAPGVPAPVGPVATVSIGLGPTSGDGSSSGGTGGDDGTCCTDGTAPDGPGTGVGY